MTQLNMRTSGGLRGLAAGALTTALLAAPATAATITTVSAAEAAPISTVHLIATLAPRTSAAADLVVRSDGTLFVAKTVSFEGGSYGQVVRISPRERVSTFGPRIRLNGGRLTGIVLDPDGTVYVASFSGTTAPNRLFQVTAKSVRVVATTSGYSAPEGLAFHHGRLFVTDPYAGVVWRFRPGDSPVTLTSPWLRGARLQPDPPASGKGLGVNGIAFWNGRMFLTNTDKGTLLKVRVGAGRDHGPITVVTHRPILHGADGIAFDSRGLMWVSAHGFYSEDGWTQGTRPSNQRVMLFTRAGSLWHATTDASWMNYPNAVAFAATAGEPGRMIVLNGSRYGWPVTVVSFRLH